jgi:hypothetical protein
MEAALTFHSTGTSMFPLCERRYRSYGERRVGRRLRIQGTAARDPPCGVLPEGCEIVPGATRRGRRSGEMEDTPMPKFIIERNIAGAGKLSTDEMRDVSQKSCDVLREMGPQIQWVHSYVTGDKVYCVYIAPNEQTIREHAKRGGFPADRIAEVKRMIDPTTAE